MFNKKHYTAIAKSLRDSKPQPFNWFNYEVWKKVVYMFAHDLAQDNPHFFNEERFLINCGEKVKPPKDK